MADNAQARIEEYQSQISDLEEQTRELQENNNILTEELAKLRQEKEAQASEIETVRSRSNLSQQNWIKERDELISREAYAREEFENAKQAMQDWEVLAMNERSLRENLAEKDSELREQLESMREEYEKAARDRDTNNQAVEGLQKALQEVQTRTLCIIAQQHLQTDHVQYGKPSSKSPSKPTNVKSTTSESKSEPQSPHPYPPKQPSCLPRKSLNGPYLSKKRSKKRTS
jgi:chromosome segregation ATPase